MNEPLHTFDKHSEPAQVAIGGVIMANVNAACAVQCAHRGRLLASKALDVNGLLISATLTT